MLLSPSSTHFARLMEMPARCFAKCELLSKTCSEFRAVLNSLKSHYNKIPPQAACRLRAPSAFTHSWILTLACTCLKTEKGEKVSPRRETKGKNYPWARNQRPQGGKIGRSLENSSTLLRPHISSGKNNGYFLRFLASVEMKTPRWEIPRNENAASFWFAIMPALLIIAVELN